MAAADLARGRSVSDPKISQEVTYLLLAKEFSWTPKQVDEQDSKKMRALTHMLSVFNKVKNAEMDKITKGK